MNDKLVVCVAFGILAFTVFFWGYQKYQKIERVRKFERLVSELKNVERELDELEMAAEFAVTIPLESNQNKE